MQQVQHSDIQDKARRELDVLIIGAGLSGIGVASQLAQKMPDMRYEILEGRERLGGTWDLFRYPGIRSDADMYTFGYAFRPWRQAKDIAAAPDILDYLRETAETYGVDRHIHYQHRVIAADWDSAAARWTLTVTVGDSGEKQTWTCRFLVTCTGYYDYQKGYVPEFEGMEDFQGTIAHPQHWPEDLDYGDKRVVVIGSGATAVTLVPNLARKAAHVTMLQRSPTYIFDRPAEDAVALTIKRWLPERLGYPLIRLKNIVLTLFLFTWCRKRPEAARKFFKDMARSALGPDFDVDRHFTPPYDPWDQRLCMIPDSDLFNVLREGQASVVTDQIERFTTSGIALKSGEQLEADIIVPATGLNLKLLDGMTLTVDGKAVNFAERVNYRGMMFSEVPNMMHIFGYTNAPWTLKADLSAAYLCRMLRHMKKNGYRMAMPSLRESPSAGRFRDMGREPIVGLSSGYIQRALPILPRQGSMMPWRNHDNYIKDRIAIRYGRLNDGAMVFR